MNIFDWHIIEEGKVAPLKKYIYQLSMQNSKVEKRYGAYLRWLGLTYRWWCACRCGTSREARSHSVRGRSFSYANKETLSHVLTRTHSSSLQTVLPDIHSTTNTVYIRQSKPVIFQPRRLLTPQQTYKQKPYVILGITQMANTSPCFFFSFFSFKV